MKKKVDLSIIILSFNTLEILRGCLRSIEATDKGKYHLETIVVDNASIDKSPQMIKKEFKWVKLIESKSNLGFAKGNNLVIPYAQGRYLLFLNSDTVLPEQIFPEIINYMDESRNVGAFTVRLRLKDGGIDVDCHRGFPTPWASISYFLGFEKLFPKSKIFGQYHQFYRSLDKIHEIDSICGAFLLIRKEALNEIGDWDESYFFYGEDIDLCYRLHKKGWKIIYYPKIEVIHYKGASSGLRAESKSIAKIDKATRLKVARASVEAMKIFYNKFYRQQYSGFVTSLTLLGIDIRGWFRLIVNYLR